MVQAKKMRDRQSIRDQVLQVLTKKDKASLLEIQTELNLSAAQVYDAIYRLRQKGEPIETVPGEKPRYKLK